MKKHYFIPLFFAFFLLGNFAKSQNIDDKWLSEGTVMKYIVNNDYDFTLTLVNLQNGVEFDWTMKAGAKKGTVKMTSDALINATNQNNYFKPSDSAYTNMTTVWVSSKVYRSLKSNVPIVIKPQLSDETLSFKGIEKIKVKIDGKEKELSVLYAETDKGSKFWIWDNPKAPIIFHMKLSFEILITDITTKN
jgi:hypothetical protein